MSWDSYIENLVAQTKDASGTAHCDRACIIGLDGGAAWTSAGHANALKVTACACIAISSSISSKKICQAEKTSCLRAEHCCKTHRDLGKASAYPETTLALMVLL